MNRNASPVLEKPRPASNDLHLNGDKIELFVRHEAAAVPTVVVTVRGRLDYYNAGAFQSFLRRHLTPGPVWIVLDLAGLVHLASSGINTLVELAEEIALLHGEFVMVSVPPSIRQWMGLLGLEGRLPVHLSLKDALEDLGQPQRHRKFRPVFPLTVPCPSCGKKLPAVKEGKYRCAICRMPFQIDDRGRVGLV